MAKKYKYFTLQIEMLKNNETVDDIGKVLGVSGNCVRFKMDGIHEWTIEEIDKICEHYGKDYYELFKKD